MIPIGLIIFTVIIINSILIFADIFLYKKVKKVVSERNYDPLLSKFYLFTIPIFAFWLVLNSGLRWLNPIPSKFVVFSNYLLTFWYLPKFLIFLAIVIGTLIKRLIFIFSKRSLQQKNSATSEGRRKFVTALGWGAVGLPYLALAHESFKTTLNPKVSFVEVPILNLPKSFKDLKFVQISDIHAGSLPSVGFFQKIVEIINSLSADFVLITGDFVNFSSREIDLIGKSLSEIYARYSVLACPGNHEHYMKQSEFEELIRKIREFNVDILINENRVFFVEGEKLQIAGVDNTSHRMNYADFNKALKGLDKDLPIILLCHDPTNWDKSVRGKLKVDLMLSGHTHGGQIALEVFNSKISPAAFFYKQYAGLYSDGEQHLYVNTGVGMVGVPVRAGLPPEITMIRLVEPEQYT
ncbi:MAG: metallophosphoesterase [Ignavibacteria bacterium]|nr:metallophosphoesterase [Ignavibacteria bacterium]